MPSDNDTDIKKQKGAFWSRPGAAIAYEAGISSRNGIVQLKNRVERKIVLQHAKGRILDAGTGTGRFALPLAQRSPGAVVALDYSLEMLTLNRELSSKQQLDLMYVQGDVEHLPFPAGCFDTVVSITVVRHFPQYRNILKEYARVLKPGGKMIFEMCSGDHIASANRVSPRFGTQFRHDDFFSYEAEVPFDDLRAWLNSIGIDVVDRLTYDFFNNNCFLKIVTVNDLGYKIVNKAIGLMLRLVPLQMLAAWMELKVLRHLPPAFSCDYMVIGQKR